MTLMSLTITSTHLLCQFIQHAWADGGSVGTEDVLLSLLHLPVVFVPGAYYWISLLLTVLIRMRPAVMFCCVISPLWTEASLRVDPLHSLQVGLRELVGECRVWKTITVINTTRMQIRATEKWLRNSVSPDRKKVSCWSLAGCCWGWNRESKFQKELSMKLLVGISVKLQRAEGSFSVLHVCLSPV